MFTVYRYANHNCNIQKKKPVVSVKRNGNHKLSKNNQVRSPTRPALNKVLYSGNNISESQHYDNKTPE